MTNLQALASKYRRALRNGTGARFTHEELQALANIGTLETLQIAEARELQSSWAANTRRSADQMRTTTHTDCCPALALTVLGQHAMAREAASICEGKM